MLSCSLTKICRKILTRTQRAAPRGWMGEGSSPLRSSEHAVKLKVRDFPDVLKWVLLIS